MIYKTCLWLLLTGLVAGCGTNGYTVSGTVTVNDNPLEYGSINFSSPTGAETPFGCMINDGKFEANDALPGTYRATVVVGHKFGAGDIVTDEMRGAGPRKKKPDNNSIVILPTSAGNGQTVEIKAEDQVLNIAIDTSKDPKQ